MRCNKPKGRTLDRETDAPAVSTDELKVAPRSAFLERKSALPLGSQTPQPGGANQPAKSPPVHSAHSHLHVRQLDFHVATPTSAVPDPNPREALSAPPLCSLSPQPGGAFQPAKRTTPLRSDFSHELVAQALHAKSSSPLLKTPKVLPLWVGADSWWMPEWPLEPVRPG